MRPPNSFQSVKSLMAGLVFPLLQVVSSWSLKEGHVGLPLTPFLDLGLRTQPRIAAGGHRWWHSKVSGAITACSDKSHAGSGQKDWDWDWTIPSCTPFSEGKELRPRGLWWLGPRVLLMPGLRTGSYYILTCKVPFIYYLCITLKQRLVSPLS